MKKYRLSLFLITGVYLFGVANLVGSHLDAEGMLIEPAFFCIPLGYLAFISSLLTATLTFFTNKKLI